VNRVATCTHLDQIRAGRPGDVGGCEECLEIGAQWVHLRVCRSCGLVACCDSSPNQHASRHVAATGHQIVSSLEPGEDWSWCYVDEVAFVVESDVLGSGG
jgi:Zn-finger in ubiquitin-hydrolases and other protein